MKTSFTYLADTIIEVIVDGDSVTWNVLPSVAAQEPVLATPTLAATPEPSSAPDPGMAEVPMTLAAAPTKKRRTLMGAIRGAWFIIFTFAGEAVQYGIDNLTGLSLPPKTGMVVGASLYAAKRAIWPNSVI
jgi:hypothetical protein